MPIPDLCLDSRDFGGAGGYAGGAGAETPASGNADGKGVSGKGLPVIKAVTGMKVDLVVALYNTLCGDDAEVLSGYSSMKFIAKETYNAANTYIDKTVTVTAPAEGLITLSLVPDDLPYAGIWTAGIQGFDADDNLIGQYPCYLVVEKGLDHTARGNSPISMSEVRMALRDVCPDFNTLLLDLEFSDTEIAFAMVRPVDEWNETPPETKTYTPATFPWREAWRKATCAYLLKTAALHYARNEMTYNAGGVSVKDMDKAGSYIKLAEDLLGEWQAFLIRQKIQQNANACYTRVLSNAFR